MIVVNLDVVMAMRKIGVGELAEKVDITMANLSILKNNKAQAKTYWGKVLEIDPNNETAKQALK